MSRNRRRANAKSAGRALSRVASGRLPQDDTIKNLFAAATVHYRNGDVASAQSLCRTILACDSGHVQSLVLLGDMAQQNGCNNQAVKLLKQALALDHANAAAHDNIAIAYQALGRRKQAILHFTQAIVLGLRDVETLVKQSAAVAVHLRRFTDAWPKRLPLAELFGAQGPGSMSGEALLLALLQSRPVFDVELERFLAAIRRGLLEDATENGIDVPGADALELFSAVSQQCFINEYVFAIDDDERIQSQQIGDRIMEALKSDRDVSALDLVVAASYMPLHRLPMASSLLNRTWPDSITRLLTQQVEEPLEEEADWKNIPALTVVDDPVSLQIQKQYEENPYPRWTVSPTVTPTTIENYLASTIGLSSASWSNTANDVDILIAGCGTGSHSIETAHLFPQSRILALDISRASLAYARRKTGALAITNIEYGQADILKLGSIDRRFDLIEAVGVLHHLSDPAAGWRVLLSLLRPKGLMAVGLYSSLARQSVTAARAQIAERGYGASVEDIRTYRQELILRDQVPPFKDFWSTSGCRDLLFNVVEHQFTIPEIKAFLDANQLTFLGFEQLPAATVSQYQHQFPGAVAQRDLASWHAFEQMHPFTFANMYIFWVQKNAPVSPPARST